MFSKKFNNYFFSRDKPEQMREMLLEVGHIANRFLRRAGIPEGKREELVQEILFDTSKISLEKSIENPKAYIKQIMRLKVATHIEKKKQLEPKKQAYEVAMKAIYIETSLSQVDTLATKQKHQSLLDKIYVLPPPQPVLMLCALGFQSCITAVLYEESASQMGLDVRELQSKITQIANEDDHRERKYLYSQLFYPGKRETSLNSYNKRIVRIRKKIEGGT